MNCVHTKRFKIICLDYIVLMFLLGTLPLQNLHPLDPHWGGIPPFFSFRLPIAADSNLLWYRPPVNLNKRDNLNNPDSLNNSVEENKHSRTTLGPQRQR